jgi:hypothetical protein
MLAYINNNYIKSGICTYRLHCTCVQTTASVRPFECDEPLWHLLVVAAEIRRITSNTAPVRVNNEIWAEINIRILLNNHQIHGFEVQYTDLLNPQISETLTLENKLQNVLTSRTEDPAEDSPSSQLGIVAASGRARTAATETAAAPAGRPWQSEGEEVERGEDNCPVNDRGALYARSRPTGGPGGRT